MKKLFLTIMMMSTIISCKTTPPPVEKDAYVHPDTYNVKFIVYDEEITNPDNDRRSYYRIFIDKIEEGRTTTGLESQEKVFETYLEPNRHLIMVEKWVLDKRDGKYIKLNNIDQPKPNFTYFTVPDDRIVVITMITQNDTSTSFSVEYARQ